MPPVPPLSALFPYTTLFRSPRADRELPPVGTRPSTADPEAPLSGHAHCVGTSEQRHLADEQGAVSRREDPNPVPRARSEEHTSELQSRVDLVCRLLLEKKKK